MVIDDIRGFNSDKDELIWTKIINVSQTDTNNAETTQVVEYYQTESEEYYIFENVDAFSNSNITTEFQGYNWKEVVKQIDFSNSCYIYSRSNVDENYFGFVTMGRSIKKKNEESKDGISPNLLIE